MVAFRELDIVFFYFGINDCVPRLFNKHGIKILFQKYCFKNILEKLHLISF